MAQPISDVIIGQATLDDAAELAAYAARLFAERLPGILDRPAPTLQQEVEWLSSYLDSPNSTVLVAEADGAIVGLLDFLGEAVAERRHCGMFGISVGTEFRGQGVGSALLEALFAWAPMHGIRRIEGHAWANNPRALQLYERLGFEREGTMRGGVIRDGEAIDVILLAKAV